jgi:hypothetical protein
MFVTGPFPLDAYRERIGFAGTPRADLATLRAIAPIVDRTLRRRRCAWRRETHAVPGAAPR